MAESPAPWADTWSKWAHTIFVVAGVALTVFLLIFSSTDSVEKNSSFLTNTFLSAYYSDTPAVTYSPAGDPFVASQVSDTYYRCLHKAQVGANDNFGCKLDNLVDYTKCVIAKTSSPEYRTLRVAQLMLDVLTTYRGDSWNISAIPSPVTSSSLTDLVVVIGTPAVQQQLIYDLEAVDSILARDLIAVLKLSPDTLGTQGCLRSVQQGPGILHDISPVYDALWACTAGVIYTEPANHRAYDLCIPHEAWPAIDVLQTPYSSSLLGSYNKHFALLVGVWIMCSFGVYSAFIGQFAAGKYHPTVNGKPANIFDRGGVALTVFALAWNAAAIVMVLVRSFSDPSKINNFSMTVQTVMVTLLFSLLATLYFSRELWELLAYKGKQKKEDQAPLITPGPSGALRYSQPKRSTQLTYFMRVPELETSSPLETPQFTPLFVPAWSDCWVLSDGLIIMGIIGYSNDVVTADLVLCFFYVLAAAVANSSLVRLLYHGYINEVPAGNGEYTAIYNQNAYLNKPASELADDERARQGIRVMAMVSDIASILFSMVFWFIAFLRYGDNNTFIVCYLIFATLVPTLLWLALNLVLDMEFEMAKNSLYYPAQFIFIYNVLIRSIFVLIIIVGISKDAEALYTNGDSLQAMLKFINPSETIKFN